jgi:hypothetical protein
MMKIMSSSLKTSAEQRLIIIPCSCSCYTYKQTIYMGTTEHSRAVFTAVAFYET